MHKLDKKTLVLLILVGISSHLLIPAQTPQYTPKHFVTKYTPEFVATHTQKDGIERTYLVATPVIWDVDDHYTTYVQHAQKVLICIEGQTLLMPKAGGSFYHLSDR